MGERVLVVDDARDIRKFLHEYVLKPRGFETVLAADAQEALGIVAEQPPDLIITDIVLPQMSGLDMLDKLVEMGLEVPTILMTAHGTEETAIRALRLGVKNYVVKPFEIPEMVEAIDKALHETRLSYERDALTKQLMESSGALQRRMEEFNALYDTGKLITSSLDLQQVLNRVAEAAVQLTGGEEGFLMLLDEENDELYVRASKNLNSEVREMRLAVKDGLAGQVMSAQKPVIIDDQDRWEKIKTAYLVRSLIYVPLISFNQSIGILGVVNRDHSKLFSAHHTQLMQSLAEFAVIAIQNANLYSATENARHQLYASLRQTDVPFLFLDDGDKIVLVNRPMRTILQLPDGDWEARPLKRFLSPQTFKDFANLLEASDESFQSEIELANGEIFWAQVNVIDGVGRCIILNEVTQLKEAARLKSEFVSAVSHDLRSPLTAIRGYVELLDRAGPLSEMQRQFIDRVHDSIAHISAMISDLLDLDRLESGRDLTMGPCQMEEILEDVLALLEIQFKERAQELTFDIPTQALPPVLGNELRLRQALHNLLSNANKYTPENGRIYCRLRPANDQIIITITDTGIGISRSDQAQLFEKFFRADKVKETHQGTGLGLSIVKSVIERHHGRIWVNSELGKGTTFTIVLPTLQV